MAFSKVYPKVCFVRYSIQMILIYFYQNSKLTFFLFFNIKVSVRNVETAAYNSTRPNLLIDGNTKVICQGFTGKQVGKSINYIFNFLFTFDFNFYLFRAHFTVNKLLTTALKWSVVFHRLKLVLNI